MSLGYNPNNRNNLSSTVKYDTFSFDDETLRDDRESQVKGLDDLWDFSSDNNCPVYDCDD